MRAYAVELTVINQQIATDGPVRWLMWAFCSYTGHGGVTNFHGRCGVFGCYFQPVPHGKAQEKWNSLAGVVRSQQGSLGACP